MQEVLPREASEPAEGQEAAALPRLRIADFLGNSLPIQIAVCAVAGLLLSLANPPAGIWPIAFIALTPLLWLLRSVRPRRGFLLGFAFGFAYFAATMYWLLLFGKLAWGGLAFANAVYIGVFGLVAPALWRSRRPVFSSVAVAALWMVLELCRGTWPMGGLTWGGLGYSQAANPTTLPLASLTGVWGISFVAVSVNGLILVAAGAIRGSVRPGVTRRIAAGALAALLILAPALIPIPAPNGASLDVAAVQVDVPKGLAIDPLLEDRIVADMHAKLYRTLQSNPPQLGIWAENSLDQDPTRDPSLSALVTGAVRDVGAPTLIGAIDGPKAGPNFNESLLYAPNGEIADVYTKTHLVPFGEYVPFRSRLSFLQLLQQIPRDLTPGGPPHPLHYNGLDFGNVICFENSFPGFDRSMVNQGAQFLVTSTNNASYLQTAASRQHLLMDRLRAVENARWVVHSAISGITAFVDPNGGVHNQTDLFASTIARRSIQLSTRKTIYTRFGDWFVFLGLVTVGLAFLSPRRKRQAPHPPPELPQIPKTLVILPTFDERQTVEEVIDGLIGLDQNVDILVVDDNSPDGTGEIVSGIAAAEPRVRLLGRPRKAGLASAYLTGFRQAIQEEYDLAVEMDSDLSHSPDELSGLLDAARSSDLVIGSRYVPGGAVNNWSRARIGLSKAGNLYARLALGFPFMDATSGFRVYRRDLLNVLLEDGIHSDGYGFQIELAYRSWLHGFVVSESPISFREREHGTSKISRRIIVEALWLVTRWGVRDRLRAPQPSQGQSPIMDIMETTHGNKHPPTRSDSP